MTDGFPIEYDNSIVLISGMYRVTLPNDKHSEAVLIHSYPKFVHRTPCLDYKAAEKLVDSVNEWARKRGGRPVVKRPDPKTYMNDLFAKV